MKENILSASMHCCTKGSTTKIETCSEPRCVSFTLTQLLPFGIHSCLLNLDTNMWFEGGACVLRCMQVPVLSVYNLYFNFQLLSQLSTFKSTFNSTFNLKLSTFIFQLKRLKYVDLPLKSTMKHLAPNCRWPCRVWP